MFYSDRLISILPTDRVLEIGPGATPHPRSDVFLEKIYSTVDELIAQSGNVGILQTNKQVVTYSGDRFPFKDKEFDYVICSHVLEHVDDADIFLKEVQRVGKKGYLEFPTIYYDYLYNIPEHNLFLYYDGEKINWMKKNESSLNEFKDIQRFFLTTLESGYYNFLKIDKFFFQGFEWHNRISTRLTSNISDVVLDVYSDQILKDIKDEIKNVLTIPLDRSLKGKIKRGLVRLINKF